LPLVGSRTGSVIRVSITGSEIEKETNFNATDTKRKAIPFFNPIEPLNYFAVSICSPSRHEPPWPLAVSGTHSRAVEGGVGSNQWFWILCLRYWNFHVIGDVTGCTAGKFRAPLDLLG
jgi:hypothetical protein